MKRKYYKKSTSEIMAVRINKCHNFLFAEIKNLQKLREKKDKMDAKEYKIEFKNLKEEIELLTKLTGPLGYLAQTHTGMVKTVLDEKRVYRIIEKNKEMRKLIAPEILKKIENIAEKIVPPFTDEELNNFK